MKHLACWWLLLCCVILVGPAHGTPPGVFGSWITNKFPWFSTPASLSPSMMSAQTDSPPRGGSSSMTHSSTTIMSTTSLETIHTSMGNHQHYQEQQNHHQLHDPNYHREEAEDQMWNAHPPEISLEEMVKALRQTCEWNRRLQVGIMQQPKILKHLHQEEGVEQMNHNNVDDNDSSSTVTIFHAKTPRVNQKKQLPQSEIERWGPELTAFLQRLSDMLGLEQDDFHGGRSVIPALAILYLDRACSVETPRSNGILPTPFCTPRTVHRLCLVAMLIATQAIKGGTTAIHYYPRLQALGIPLSQLLQMESWMRGALGDPGLFVTSEQLMSWRRIWEKSFSPADDATGKQQQQQPQEQQRIEQVPDDTQPLNNPPPPNEQEQQQTQKHISDEQLSTMSNDPTELTPPSQNHEQEQEQRQHHDQEELRHMRYAAAFHSYQTSSAMDGGDGSTVVTASSSTIVGWS